MASILTQAKRKKKRSRLSTAALVFWSNLELFSEQDDQKNDQQNETADTDIHR
jgi:hypothetical protein